MKQTYTKQISLPLLLAGFFAMGPLALLGCSEPEANRSTHDHAEPHEGAPDPPEKAVSLDPKTLLEFDIEVRTAQQGAVAQVVRLPGEVVYNADQIAEVTPTVAGIAARIDVSVGDEVAAGDVLAVLNSKQLAAARSDYRAAKARVTLARANLERDTRMYEEKVGSERAVLEARQAFHHAEITLREAETTLHALGMNDAQIAQIDSLEHGALNRYELVAPLSGVVTERNITIGKVVDPAAREPALVVADLSTVWVNLTVYQRNLVHVRPGLPVHIEFGHGVPDTTGSVSFVSPALDEETRTAFARIVLENPDRHWRPGLFVDGVLDTGRRVDAVVVPQSAVIGLGENQVVFVKEERGFVPTPVRIARETEREVVIDAGLVPGERYAATGVLALKTALRRSELEHAGHAH